MWLANIWLRLNDLKYMGGIETMQMVTDFLMPEP